MRQHFSKAYAFLDDDSGAVTTDFVVLTAAICTLGAVVVLTVVTGAQATSNATRNALSSAELPDVGSH